MRGEGRGKKGEGDALPMHRGAGCTGGGHTQGRRPYAIEKAVHDRNNVRGSKEEGLKL